MNDKDYAPLNNACIRALNDKLYEKRKVGALEVERVVRECVVSNQTAQIKRVLKILGEDFALSHNPNTRKGGLIGLAATAIALSKESSVYINELVKPVLANFQDQDSRVRYYSCEALYNIVKVARGSVLPYFNDIFDGLSKLTADPDQNVKNGTELLDRLIKDIVIESSSFNLVAFIPLLRERVYTKNPFARQFIVSWIAVLDAVPDINMLVLLPEILDGLFQILGDTSKEISKMCQAMLDEFLHGIRKADTTVNYAGMANILTLHSQSQDDLIQCTAMSWLKEFITQADRAMLPFVSGILNAILPCLAYDSQSRKEVGEAAKELNNSLMNLIRESDDIPTPKLGTPLEESNDKNVNEDENKTEEKQVSSDQPSKEEVLQKSAIQLDISSVINVLSQALQHAAFQTRIASLRWLCHLLNKAPNKTFRHINTFFPLLLKTLSDQSQEVVLLDLEVLAEVSSNPAGQTVYMSEAMMEKNGHVDIHTQDGLNQLFTKFIVELVQLFKTDHQLLEDRGAFIVRQLSQLLNSEDIFQSLSEILLQEEDMGFTCTMVQILNSILLTSTELFDLRNQLKNLKTKRSCSLFCCLYKTWCHSPVATVSLCFLTQNYKHACHLLETFGDLEVTVDFLKEIDKLVQLIESPIFVYLRLQLLDVHNNQDLIKSLYGLLMLLPQSEAFKLLRYRLDCIPHYQLATITDKLKTKGPKDSRPLVSKINFEELHAHFLHVMAKHREAKQKHSKTAKTVDS
ncbi:hypothetical protein ScPMuIL_000940 [Solemya velum]